MNKASRKELFTVIGKIEIVEGRHRFIPNSTDYLADQLKGLPPKTELSCTFAKHVATRSQSQLAYYWIILDYLAKHIGDIKEELHECIMIELFGTKKRTFNGKDYYIRQSISDKALFPKYRMVDLISYTLNVCNKLGVNVPTPEELGYQSNQNNKKLNHVEFHKNIEKPKGVTPF